MFKKKKYIARIVAFIFLFTTIFANTSVIGLANDHMAKITGTINLNGRDVNDLRLNLLDSTNQSVAEFIYSDVVSGDNLATVTDTVYGDVYASFDKVGETVQYAVYAGTDVGDKQITGVRLHAFTGNDYFGYTALVGPVTLGNPVEQVSVSSVVYNVYSPMDAMTLVPIESVFDWMLVKPDNSYYTQENTRTYYYYKNVAGKNIIKIEVTTDVPTDKITATIQHASAGAPILSTSEAVYSVDDKAYYVEFDINDIASIPEVPAPGDYGAYIIRLSNGVNTQNESQGIEVKIGNSPKNDDPSLNNDLTSDWSEIDDFTAAANFSFGKVGYGQITFAGPIDLTSTATTAQFDALRDEGALIINEGEAGLSNALSAFKTGATLKMFNVPSVFESVYLSDIEYYAEGSAIPTTPDDSKITSLNYDNGTLTLSVSGFSKYKAVKQLAAPAKPTLSDDIASWTGVENANAGYSVQLYKGDTALGSPVSVAAGVYEHDFSASMTGAGSYTVKVTAKGTGFFKDSAQSTASAAQVVTSSSNGSSSPTTTTTATTTTTTSQTSEQAQSSINNIAAQPAVTAEQATTAANAAATITGNLTSSTATDSEKAANVGTASASVADLATIISKTTDASAANSVASKAVEMIGTIAAATASINDEASAAKALDGASAAIGNAASLVTAVKDAAQQQTIVEKTTEVLKAITQAMEKITAEKAVEVAQSVIENAAKVVAADKNEKTQEAMVKEVVKVAEKAIEKLGKETTVPQVEGQKAKAVITEAAAANILSKADAVVAKAKELAEKMEQNNIKESIETKITIEVPKQENATEVQTVLPANIIDAVKAKGIEKLEVAAGIATVAMPSGAIDTTGASSVNLGVKEVNKEAELTSEQKTAVGNSPVFDFNASVVKANGEEEKVSSFSKAVEVMVPYTPAEDQDIEKITVFYINDKGELENKSGKYNPETKMVVFTTEHFSKYVIKQNNVAFSDMSSAEWARKYVEVMASKGIIKGMTSYTFKPNATVTRAQFAAMLTRAFNLPESSTSITDKFSDTKADAWYAKAVVSAVEAGLVTGYENGTFKPDANITRQEMAVMVARAAKAYKGSVAPSDINKYMGFADSANVNAYAKDSIALAVKYEIVNGKPGNVFDPTSNATRSEAAKIIYMIYNM